MLDFSQAPIEQHIDADKVRQSLVDSLESWLPNLLPEGRVICGEYRAGSVRGEKGGSLCVALRGEKRGLWFDHATGEKGDVFTLIMAALGCDFAGALEYARGTHYSVPARAVAAECRGPDPEMQRQVIAGIFAGTTRIDPFHPVSNYLLSRALSVDICDDIRVHPGLWHHPSGTRWPAMVAIIRNVHGEEVGIHRTYIDGNTCKKADVTPNRMMLGACRGGAVRLANPNTAEGMLGICEGIETGLAAMQIAPGLAVWAALSTSGMRAIEIPESIKNVVILADKDEMGEHAARALCTRLVREGRKVSIARPAHTECKDFNEQLLQGGK